METSLEQIMTQVRALAPEQRARLRVWLEQDSIAAAPQPKTTGMSPEMLWLKKYGRAYIGQWVALAGDQLLAHGKEHRAVWEVAKSFGRPLPLIHWVEDPEQPVWNGLG